MIGDINQKRFEDKLIRLFHFGRPMDWLALEDEGGGKILMCEKIRYTDREYMKRYGWHIDKYLSQPTEGNLLMVMDLVNQKLVHVFDCKEKFDVSMIPELTEAYISAEEITWRGLGEIKPNKRLVLSLLYLVAVCLAGYLVAQNF